MGSWRTSARTGSARLLSGWPPVLALCLFEHHQTLCRARAAGSLCEVWQPGAATCCHAKCLAYNALAVEPEEGSRALLSNLGIQSARFCDFYEGKHQLPQRRRQRPSNSARQQQRSWCLPDVEIPQQGQHTKLACRPRLQRIIRSLSCFHSSIGSNFRRVFSSRAKRPELPVRHPGPPGLSSTPLTLITIGTPILLNFCLCTLSCKLQRDSVSKICRRSYIGL